MNNILSSWYLVYTKPKHENKFYNQLVEYDIEGLLPVRKKISQWHDRKKWVYEPVFPSYVFVKISNKLQYFDIAKFEGFLYYVKFGKKIAKVQDSVIENIKLLINDSIHFEVSSQVFKPGTKMIIKEGPLSGLSCELVDINSNPKLLVRVELLRRSILISQTADNLIVV